MKKRILAILLTSMLLLAACGPGGGQDTAADPGGAVQDGAVQNGAAQDGAAAPAGGDGRWPDYISLGRGLPVIREDMRDDVLITMAISQSADGGSWDDLWISHFYRDILNINFQVEQIMDIAREERMSLMFAADDLPDILMNLGISPANIIRFGQMEGQLLDLNPFIDPELTPFMYDTFAERPDARAMAQTPDGAMYSLPNINSADEEGSVPRIFVDRRWLSAAGLTMPRTLDEFSAMLRTFKEVDPTGVGSENVIPLGGAHEYFDPSWYILNALGFITGEGRGALSDAGLRQGEAVIPAGHELYLEFLTIMNAFYEEGIISDNFFLASPDGVEVNGQLMEGRIGVFGFPVYAVGYPDWYYWDALPPLTSIHQPTPEWRGPPVGHVGGFAMSSSARHPAAGMAFADLYFSEYGRLMWTGPGLHQEEFLLGFHGPGLYWDDEIGDVSFNMEGYPPHIDGLWHYLMALHTPMPQFGTLHMREVNVMFVNRWLGGNLTQERTFNLADPDMHYRATVYATNMPYVVQGFPNVFYLDDDMLIQLTDLQTVIQPYIWEQTALFITGRRPLNEFDDFQAELQTIGIDRLEAIFSEIWEHQRR